MSRSAAAPSPFTESDVAERRPPSAEPPRTGLPLPVVERVAGPALLVLNLLITVGVWAAVMSGALPMRALFVLPWLLLATAVVAERAFPLSTTSRPPRGEWMASLACFLWMQLVVSVVVVRLDFAVAGLFAPVWSALGLDPAAFFARLGAGARIAIAIAVVDLYRYWTHRACHAFAPLWRIHRLHHNVTSLNAVGGFRVTWVEYFLHEVPVIGFLLGLGFPGLELALLIFLVEATGTLAHANTRLRFGLLSRLLLTRDFHVWHHDVRYRGNYSVGSHTLYDRVFGTFAIPDGQPVIGAGVALAPSRSIFAHFTEPLAADREVARPARAGGEG